MLLRLLHRLLEIFLHLERRIEQPFLRPAFDAVLRMPLAFAATALINVQRSREPVGLAEETPLLGEDEAHPLPMIRIAITAEAYEAIAATLALGSIGYEVEPAATSERFVWVEEVWANKLGAMRGPGESYSDVILRLIELEAQSTA